MNDELRELLARSIQENEHNKRLVEQLEAELALPPAERDRERIAMVLSVIEPDPALHERMMRSALMG